MISLHQRPRWSARVLWAVSACFIMTAEYALADVTAIGGCDDYSPIGGVSVTCSLDGSNPDNEGVRTKPQDTSNNNVTVDVETGVVLDVKDGSAIGLGHSSNVTNKGTLFTSGGRFSYGISSGVNERSTDGGNTFINEESGFVLTESSDGHGVYINARDPDADSPPIKNDGNNSIENKGTISTMGNRADGIRLYTDRNVTEDSIINSGSITTSGADAAGIHVQNTSTETAISNSGTITVNDESAHGILIEGAARVVNSGTILANPLGYAFYVEDNDNTGANTLTIEPGSEITGGLRFSATRRSETLVFANGLGSDINFFEFNNAISGLNQVEVEAGSQVAMGAGSYDLIDAMISIGPDATLDITGNITSSGSLIKRGDGTLELAGENSFTGGMQVESGTLGLDGDAASGAGDITMAADTAVQALSGLMLANDFNLGGPVEFDTQGFSATLDGILSNNSTGQLIKTGSGTLTLNGANEYSGGTVIQQGTLALFGSLASGVSVQSDAMLAGTGLIAGDVANAGRIQPRINESRSTLTIVGNYVGQDGTFASILGGTSREIEADRLAIEGAGNSVSGSTTVVVADPMGVLGKPTDGDGILLVDVSGGATSTATAFTAPRIAAGAYEYQLVQGGEDSADSWYLRADEETPQPPVVVTPEVSQRQEVALYPALQSLARQYLWSINGSLDDRRGESDLIARWHSQPMIWTRLIADRIESQPDNADDGPGIKSNDLGFQFGIDVWRGDTEWGEWRAGPVVTIGSSEGSAYFSSGSAESGDISLNAYSLGLNATLATDKGAYTDFLLSGTRLIDVKALSPLGTSITTTGWALSGSVESGLRLPLNERVAVTPQAQIYTTTVNLKDSQDAFSLVQMPTETAVVGRLGSKLSYENAEAAGPRTQFWARASVYSTLSGEAAATSFLNLEGGNTTTLQSRAPSSWTALDTAITVQASKNTQVQAGLGYQSSFDNEYRGGYGQLSMKVGF